jgi:fructan beta-fructosidase
MLLAVTGCSRMNDVTPESDTALFTEPHRPQFHFTPPSMWMNDPNGLVFLEGEYHLFYQYYPDDTVWGPMHWGHAVSRDLVHWEHLPIALYPDEHGYIFSGSAVVDWNNTSGFGKDGEPPLVAIFTYHDPERGKAGSNDHETQGIAYSHDRGRTWTKYKDNPVLPNAAKHKDFRDPNVFWHEATKRWVMALSVSDHVELWSSPDLKSWGYLSSFGQQWGAHGGVWECPDLFPVRVDGSEETRWVLILNLNPGGPQGGSGTQYFVGDFDGETFTLDEQFAETLAREEAVWLDWGRDNYAGITWADIPPADGRRIFIGWMSNWDYAQQVPTSPWRSAMTVPRSLRLVDTDAGYRLFSTPVEELDVLRGEPLQLAAGSFAGELEISGHSSSQAEVELVFDLATSSASEIGVLLGNEAGEEYRIGFDIGRGRFVSDRRNAGEHGFSDAFATRVHEAPRLVDTETLRLRLLFDVASVELFADNGATVMTEIYFPTTPFQKMSLYARDGKAQLVSGTVYRLERIWK